MTSPKARYVVVRDLLYILAALVNWLLISTHTDLTEADTVYWVWLFVPVLTYIAGCEWRK